MTQQADDELALTFQPALDLVTVTANKPRLEEAERQLSRQSDLESAAADLALQRRQLEEQRQLVQAEAGQACAAVEADRRAAAADLASKQAALTEAGRALEGRRRALADEERGVAEGRAAVALERQAAAEARRALEKERVLLDDGRRALEADRARLLEDAAAAAEREQRLA